MTTPPTQGAMLHDVEPVHAEILIATIRANPHHRVVDLVAVLARQAPDAQSAAEIILAGYELANCKSDPTGGFVALRDTAGEILAGLRHLTERAVFSFGGNLWPARALAAGTPASFPIRTANGQRVTWAVSEGLEGVAIRMTQAVAFATALIERFGGRVVEDRLGKEVFEMSRREQEESAASQRRASALNELEKLTVTAAVEKSARAYHARVAIAESEFGGLTPGTLIHPEGFPDFEYEVERRLNASYVVAVATESGHGRDLEGGLVWVRKGVTVLPPTDPAVGFSDMPAIAPDPLIADAKPPMLDSLQSLTVLAQPEAPPEEEPS